MLSPDSDVHLFSIAAAYEEEIISRDPFRGRFTFAADGDTLAVTVDEDYTVVETTRA